jgi:hypothetical protein
MIIWLLIENFAINAGPARPVEVWAYREAVKRLSPGV